MNKVFNTMKFSYVAAMLYDRTITSMQTSDFQRIDRIWAIKVRLEPQDWLQLRTMYFYCKGTDHVK